MTWWIGGTAVDHVWSSEPDTSRADSLWAVTRMLLVNKFQEFPGFQLIVSHGSLCIRNMDQIWEDDLGLSRTWNSMEGVCVIVIDRLLSAVKLLGSRDLRPPVGHSRTRRESVFLPEEGVCVRWDVWPAQTKVPASINRIPLPLPWRTHCLHTEHILGFSGDLVSGTGLNTECVIRVFFLCVRADSYLFVCEREKQYPSPSSSRTADSMAVIVRIILRGVQRSGSDT